MVTLGMFILLSLDLHIVSGSAACMWDPNAAGRYWAFGN